MVWYSLANPSCSLPAAMLPHYTVRGGMDAACAVGNGLGEVGILPSELILFIVSSHTIRRSGVWDHGSWPATRALHENNVTLSGVMWGRVAAASEHPRLAWSAALKLKYIRASIAWPDPRRDGSQLGPISAVPSDGLLPLVQVAELP